MVVILESSIFPSFPLLWLSCGYSRNSLQVEAIKSGLNPGLTLIVGPPGTGKTDTAVQIMSELYYNYPQQRTLLVTHSNHALNDLFEKIMVWLYTPLQISHSFVQSHS